MKINKVNVTRENGVWYPEYTPSFLGINLWWSCRFREIFTSKYIQHVTFNREQDAIDYAKSQIYISKGVL